MGTESVKSGGEFGERRRPKPVVALHVISFRYRKSGDKRMRSGRTPAKEACSGCN